MKRYRLMEHTADMGIRVEAKRLPELFADAAYGMFDVMTSAETIRPEKEMDVEVVADDYEELLVNWLSELLFLFEIGQMLFSEFDIRQFGEHGLAATVRGEVYAPERHPLATGIKAVTYSGLRIEEREGLYRATVVFDL